MSKRWPRSEHGAPWPRSRARQHPTAEVRTRAAELFGDQNDIERAAETHPKRA
jgi:hypothetical protein